MGNLDDLGDLENLEKLEDLGTIDCIGMVCGEKLIVCALYEKCSACALLGTDAQHYPYGIPSFRVCGSGNFWGNLGIFNSEICGNYYSFRTTGSNVCLIYRHNKRPIAVSVANPDIFLPFRKEQ